MEELIYISLFSIAPLLLICLLHCCWFCYLNCKRKSKSTIDLPPSYDELVLCEKQLPNYHKSLNP